MNDVTGADGTNIVEAARAWLAEDPDPDTRAELRALLDAGDGAALAERFGRRLEFGTAGLRGELGAGPNRMNRVTVLRTSAGVAAAVTARGGKSVVVGYDARHGSRTFALDAAAVFAGAGLDAMVLPRPLPTPVLAFAVRHLGAAAGVMVTASHNPPRDNGYKVYLDGGAQLVPPVDAEISAAIDEVGPLAELPRGDGWRWLGEEVVDAYVAAVCALPLGGEREVSVTYTPLHGVGRDVVTAAFERAGFPAPTVVAEQAEPDPDFPTVTFPNPEEPGAMDRALATGHRAGSDLVIANDPDADRCAVATAGERLTGDELGCLLAEHVLAHTAGDDRLVVTTIVSSTLLGRIADDYGVRHARTLTGFKWIVRAAGGRFVYGYEEALGYCAGTDAGPPVLDKDGVSAALLATGLAATARRAGRTLLDLRDEQARRYGLHATGQLSIRVRDLDAIAAAMVRLRARPPEQLGDRRVLGVDDLTEGTAELPATDALRFRLTGDASVIVRPSGTEPKLKCYFEVVVPVTETMARARERADAALAALRHGTAAATGLDGAT